MKAERVYHFKCYPDHNNNEKLYRWREYVRKIHESCLARIEKESDLRAEVLCNEIAWSVRKNEINLEGLPKLTIKNVIQSTIDDGHYRNVISFETLGKVTKGDNPKNRYVSIGGVKKLKVRFHKFHPTLKIEDVNVSRGYIQLINGYWYLKLIVTFEEKPYIKKMKPLINIHIESNTLKLSNGVEIDMYSSIVDVENKIRRIESKDKNNGFLRSLRIKRDNQVRNWKHLVMNAILKKYDVGTITIGKKGLISKAEFVKKTHYC